MRKVQKGAVPRSERKPRMHRVSFLMNEEEYRAVTHHLARYKIKNRSNWLRMTILTHVFRVMGEDHPTLFNENEMRR